MSSYILTMKEVDRRVWAAIELAQIVSIAIESGKDCNPRAALDAVINGLCDLHDDIKDEMGRQVEQPPKARKAGAK